MESKYQLANGMSVILLESHKSPVLAAQIWVKTGSADETRKEQGISHFIEHLLFKGTKNYKVGQIANVIEGCGGELNAYTSFDQTVYYITISSKFGHKALEVLSEMVQFPTFLETEIDNEREVVLEEIKRSNDSPDRKAVQLMFSNCYRNHPYGVPVIGYDRIVKKLSRKEILNYFYERYNPRRMTLVVSGDFKPKALKSDIKQLFSPSSKKKKPSFVQRKRTFDKIDESKIARIKVEQSAFKENHLFFCWPIPACRSNDIAAIEILAIILGQGQSSRLCKELRLQQALVNDIGVSTFISLDPGQFIVSMELPIERIPAALDQLLKSLEAFHQQGVSEAEIQKALISFENDEFYSLETVNGKAKKSGILNLLLDDPFYFPKFLKQLRKLSPQDIARVARKYLNPKNLVITLMVSESSKSYRPLLVKWHRQYQQLFLASSKKKKANDLENSNARHLANDFPKSRPLPRSGKSKSQAQNSFDKIQKWTTPNGNTLLLCPNSEAPIFSVQLAMLGGSRLDPNGKEGTASLLASTWTRQLKGFSESELNQYIESRGASLDAFSGRNSLGLSLASQSRFQADLLKVFADALLNPELSPTIFEREQKVIVEQLRLLTDQPSYQASQIFMRECFKGHPYSRKPEGEIESILKVQPEDLTSLWHASTQRQWVMAVVGCFDQDEIKKTWEAIQSQSLTSLATPFPLAEHPGRKKPVQEFHALKKEQTHIILGFKGISFGDPRKYALQVLQSVLAGQGGRLFIELRDKASLAYSVSPLTMEGLDSGYFATYIACSPAKSRQALKMMKDELDKIAEIPISAEDLSRAQQYLIGKHDIGLQRNSAVGHAILFHELYGLGYGEVLKYADRINQVSTQDVRKVAQAILGQNAITVAVGPENPFL